MNFLTSAELIEMIQKEDPSGKLRVLCRTVFIDEVRARDGSTLELILGEEESKISRPWFREAVLYKDKYAKE